MNLLHGRRCGPCALTWPQDTKYYSKCPQCGKPTSVITLPDSSIMSNNEALKRLNEINFARYAKGEELLPAPEQTKSDKPPVQRTTPDHIRKERLAKFDSVIQGAKFSQHEIDTINTLEEAIRLIKPKVDSSES